MIWSRRCRTVHIRVTNVGLSLDSAIGLSLQGSVTCLCVRNVPQAQWDKVRHFSRFSGSAVESLCGVAWVNSGRPDACGLERKF